MVVTGNRILDALDFLKERAKNLDAQFAASLFAFEDEDEKPDPRQIVAEFEAVQSRIARLEEVQAAYNLRVEVEVLGERITLQRVLHLVAADNRVKAFWAKAASPEEPQSYHFSAMRARQGQRVRAARRAAPGGAGPLGDGVAPGAGVQAGHSLRQRARGGDGRYRGAVRIAARLGRVAPSGARGREAEAAKGTPHSGVLPVCRPARRLPVLQRPHALIPRGPIVQRRPTRAASMTDW